VDIKKKFGDKVRSLRKKNNLSQEALALLADLDRTYIPSIEKGERNVSITVVQKLAKAFGIKEKDLFDF
jgi:transcriptional regulator with XRE-family HTH domain